MSDEKSNSEDQKSSRRRERGGRRGGRRSSGRSESGASQRGGDRNRSRRTAERSRTQGGGPGRGSNRSSNRGPGRGSNPGGGGRPPSRTPAPEPKVSATLNLGLTTWDLARTRKQQPDTDRGQLIVLRTHQQLLSAFEQERGIPVPDRSLLRIQEEAQGSCLFIPGVSSTPGDLHELAAKMADAGFNSYVLRLPFHGTDGSTISGVPWKSSLNQVQQSYRLLARGGGKVHVVGMGFGAALALHLAAMESVSSLVLLAPALIPRESRLQRLLVRLKLHRLPVVHRWLGWNADHIEGMDEARARVGKVRIPIYAAQSEDDDRACPTSVRFLQRKSRNQASRFRVFPDGGHEILARHGEQALYDDILEFCRAGSR